MPSERSNQRKHPILTLSSGMALMKTTKPTDSKKIDIMRNLREVTVKQKVRVYAYHDDLALLTRDTEEV